MYLEGPADDSTGDAAYGLEDSNLAFSNNDDLDCPLQDEDEEAEIDHYCKQFVDFMQAQFNVKYDLRSSRKRTRTQEQEEEPPQKESATKKNTDKGKNPLNIPLQSNDQVPSSSKIVNPPNVEPVSK